MGSRQPTGQGSVSSEIKARFIGRDPTTFSRAYPLFSKPLSNLFPHRRMHQNTLTIVGFGGRLDSNQGSAVGLGQVPYLAEPQNPHCFNCWGGRENS